MASRYRAGADFERRVKEHLLANGAMFVVRAAGSHGPVDLVAFYPPDSPTSPVYRPDIERLEFVQCKKHGAISKADRWALIELAAACGAVPVLAKAGPRGTPVVFQVLGRAGQGKTVA